MPNLVAMFKLDDSRFYEYVKGIDNSGGTYLTTYEDTFRSNCPIGFHYENN